MERPTALVEKLFRISGMISIGAVLFLVLVGGIVRSTGAGMGCPDWPKCFGMWVPPTDVSQLPDNYQEIYKDHGYGSTEFNVAKTWTEYINRLIGVLVGFCILGTAVLSFFYLKVNKAVAFLGISSLLLTAFQGWMGAKVVEFNLAGWAVTTHMLIALVILAILILAFRLSTGKPEGLEKQLSAVPLWLKITGGFLVLITTTQILLGTQVREEVDQIAETMGQAAREDWVANLGAWFDWHKVVYIILGVLMVVFAKGCLDHFKSLKVVRVSMWLLLGMTAAEILVGIIIANFGIPAWAQPVHLLMASLIFAIEFNLFSLLLMGESLADENKNKALKAELQPGGS